MTFVRSGSARVGIPTDMTTVTQPRNEFFSESIVPGPSKRRSGYIPTLDGWRAVAIIWVIEGHSRAWSYGWVSNHWIRATGYRGVQLFFSLSGFLICTRLLREEKRNGAISLRSFYTRRLSRIQPAAMTYLFVVALLGMAGVIPCFWRGIAGASLMVRNLWPTSLAPGYWYTAHFWSLAVEEHFYLLLPGLLVLVRRRRLLMLSALALALEIWQMVVFRVPILHEGRSWQVAQRTDVVLGGILLGSVFAVALTYPRWMLFAKTYLRSWVAVLIAAVLFFELQRHHSSEVQSTIILVYPILIVATVLHADSWLGRLLELAPVRYVGRISYSLYLWQQLFFNEEEALNPHSFHSHTLLCWVGTVSCAVASYYFVETPMIRWGHRVARQMA